MYKGKGAKELLHGSLKVGALTDVSADLPQVTYPEAGHRACGLAALAVATRET